MIVVVGMVGVGRGGEGKSGVVVCKGTADDGDQDRVERRQRQK